MRLAATSPRRGRYLVEYRCTYQRKAVDRNSGRVSVRKHLPRFVHGNSTTARPSQSPCLPLLRCQTRESCQKLQENVAQDFPGKWRGDFSGKFCGAGPQDYPTLPYPSTPPQGPFPKGRSG